MQMKEIRRRKLLLIDRPFQVRFIFISTLSGLIIFTTVAVFIGFMSMKINRDFNRIENVDVACAIEAYKAAISWSYAFALVVFFGVAWTAASALYFSHKIAGPIYNIKTKLKSHLEGMPTEKIVLRKGDYFTELADLINAYMAKNKK